MNSTAGVLDQSRFLRERIRIQQLERDIRSSKNARESAPEATKELFTRLIRDGVAEEVRAAIMEFLREIEQHRRMGRLSKTSEEMAEQFKQICQHFLMGKAKLEKLEKVIERNREKKNSAKTPSVSAAGSEEEVIETAAALREKCIQQAERILQLRERFDNQVRRDRRMEQEITDVFESCLKHMPRNERAKLRLIAQEKTKSQDTEKRVETLMALINKLASAIPAIREEEINRLLTDARNAANHKRYQDALDSLNRLFKFDSKHIDGHRLRADVYRLIGNRFAMLCELRMITELNEAEGQDFYALAEVQRENRQEDDAFVNFQKAAEREPSPKHLEAWGDIAMRMSRWSFAVNAYRKLLNVRPKCNRAAHKLGAALYEDNRQDESFHVLREAVCVSDDRAATRVCLGRIYRGGQMPNEAERSLRRAIELDANDIEAHYWLSVVLLELGEFDCAAREAQQANKLEDNRPRNRLLLARCLDALGQTQKAAEILEESIKSSTFPPLDMILAYIQFRRRVCRADAAIDTLTPILQRHPHQPQLRALFGLLMIDSGQPSQAIPYLDPAGAIRSQSHNYKKK